jgi:hypothetical protein
MPVQIELDRHIATCFGLVQWFNVEILFVVAKTTFESCFNVAARVTYTTKNERLTTFAAPNMDLHALVGQDHVVSHSLRR